MNVPHHKLLFKSNNSVLTVKYTNGSNIGCATDDRVVITCVDSEWTPAISGVPWGSILGSTLLIIYINDIDIGLSNRISKFADDK